MFGFPKWRSGKESAAIAGDTGDLSFIPGSGKSPGGENGNPLQYSCLGNPMDRGAWWVTVHGVAKIQTQLSTHTVFIFGNHWLKSPTVARQWLQLAGVVSRQEVSIKEWCAASRNLTRSIREGEGGDDMSCQVLRTLCTGIHLGWEMCVPQGRTLSLNDWPETTRKLTASP